MTVSCLRRRRMIFFTTRRWARYELDAVSSAVDAKLEEIAMVMSRAWSIFAKVPAVAPSCLLAATVCIPIGLAAHGAAAFTPVDYRGPGATIRLTRLSTYDGGYFAGSGAEVPPAYDASKRRL